MKSKLKFKFFVFFYITYLSTSFCLISQPFLSSVTAVRIGSSCTGYLFPETNYIWTLSQCLGYENTQGNIPVNIIITIQKKHSAISSSGTNNTIIEIDTLQNPSIIYKNKDWVLLSVDLPLGFQGNKTQYSTELYSMTDTFSIGFPVVTDYKADAVKNYVDWLLLPQWQYQIDTFTKRSQFNKDQLIKTNTINPFKELIAHGKNYMIDIRKSDADILKSYTLHKAIEFCIKKWTDNRFILNRLATLSTFEKSNERDRIINELTQKQNRIDETNGLAARLFITYSILPIDLLPETGSEIILTFQKDYFASARFLINHPEILNKINLSIRNIELADTKIPSKYPVWNQQDTVLEGNGKLQIIKRVRGNYWKVSGMSGAPVFSEGKLIGIQTYLPYYTSRALTFEKEMNYLSTNELKELQYLEEYVEIWKKISGIIGQ
ncbi:MAG: hypothetical protein NWQ39_06420 [Saprospiraceae bacterium]|nr:hypothetical protein [Saprospiraceae bacterium]